MSLVALEPTWWVYSLEGFFAGSFCIICEDDNEYRRFLCVCELRGILWILGYKPTDERFVGLHSVLNRIKFHCITSLSPLRCVLNYSARSGYETTIPFSEVFIDSETLRGLEDMRLQYLE